MRGKGYAEKCQARIRDILTNPGVGVDVGAGRALCAKMIERAGFDFVWSSSLCVSASFGVPDANLMMKEDEKQYLV